MPTATATASITRAPIRHKRSRARGAQLPANVISVTRPSAFGNPFTFAMAYDLGFALHGETEQARQAVVGAFDEWLRGNRDMWSNDKADRMREKILARLPELRGRDLACYCPEDAKVCHADILIKYANLPEPELTAFLARVRLRVDYGRKRDNLPPIQIHQEEVDALRKELNRLHLLWPVDPYTETYEYQVVIGGQGISGAEDEEDARHQVAKAIANGETPLTTYAQYRVSRTWDDDSQFHGPYQRLCEE